MTTEYTEQDLNGIKEYERRTGQEIAFSFDEKCKIYRTKSNTALRAGVEGIESALAARLNTDNIGIGCFEDEPKWKTKVLRENLRAITHVLSRG